MSTLSYTRRVNTGQYEHAEATWSINPDEMGLSPEEASDLVKSIVHRTVGLTTSTVQIVSDPPASASPAAITPPPVVPLPALVTVQPAAPTAVASTSEPEIDDAALVKFATHQAQRINLLKPGQGGLQVNLVTRQFVASPAGLSQVGVIGPEGDSIDPLVKNNIRRQYMAAVEAIQ